MKTYIAFLRGVNVGGGNMLSMKELSGICEGAGFKSVRTYINSGNVLFESKLSAGVLRKKLEKALLAKRGRHTIVVIRSLRQLEAILSKNPFPEAESSKVGVMLLNHVLSK